MFYLQIFRLIFTFPKMNGEENDEVFSFDDAATPVKSNDNDVELAEAPDQNVQIPFQLNISSGTQERFTPVRQPRFGRCKTCAQLRKENNQLKIEIKHEKAMVKRVESLRKSDMLQFDEEKRKRDEASVEQQKLVYWVKDQYEMLDRDHKVLKEERDNLQRKLEEIKRLL